MTTTPRLAVILILGLVAAGCGGDHVTENEASEGWRAASRPLSEGQEQIQEKAQENLDELIAGETITHVVDCEDAGDVQFSLSVELNPDDGDGPNIDLTADYRGCEADERIETNGELAIDSPQFSEVGTGGDDECDCPEPTTVHYDGHLDWSGKVDGPCDIDMTAELPPWGQPTFTGDLCGYDASDVLGVF